MSLRSASNSRCQPGRHLMAQFLAQALQFAGDLADRGDAVLLAAHAVEVARERLVGLSRSGRRGIGARGRLSSGGARAARGPRTSGRVRAVLGRCAYRGGSRSRPPGSDAPAICRLAADALFQRFERAVELLDRAVRPALPAGVRVFRDRTVCCSSKRPLSIGRLAASCSKVPCRERTAPREIAAAEGALPGRSSPPSEKP